MSTKKQIECLNQASEAKTGMSFLSLLHTGSDRILDVVHDAMELAQIACLEKAAENATIEDVTPISRMYGAREYAVDKESITSRDNLV